MFKKKQKVATTQDALSALEELRDTSRKMSEEALAKMRESNEALTNKEKRFLEYFWSRKKLKWREEIPFNVLHFLINDDEPINYTELEVHVVFLGLQNKGYVKVKGFSISQNNSSAAVILERKGVNYLKDKHPQLEILFDRFFEKIPFLVKLIVGLIGLVASILGIIDFISKTSSH